VDDIEDDEEFLVEDVDQDEPDGEQVGDEVLYSEFRLTGMQAKKQRLMTDSVVLKEFQQR
jgi:hypothetical protein